MRELISKLVAGGLSAAVILLWWPQFFPAEDATAWLIRGVVWTLSFELLLHALMPIERALWDTRAGITVRSRASAAGERIGSPRQSLGGRTAVAFGAVAVPLALLAFAPPQPPKHHPVASVRQVTEVKRIVRVVKRPVRVASVASVQRSAAPVASITSERVRVAKPIAPRTTPSTPRTTTTKPPRSSTQTQTAAPQSGSSSGATAPEASGQQQSVVAPRVAAERRVASSRA